MGAKNLVAREKSSRRKKCHILKKNSKNKNKGRFSLKKLTSFMNLYKFDS